MKREFTIERQGRSFVLYAGLLDEAHQKGLKSIRTRLIQPPTPENGETTICHAEVELEDGRVFAGIGDATPQNVGRNIVPHAIRMAETRAKARALRDAINVGAVAVEELGDLDDEPGRMHNGVPLEPVEREMAPLKAAMREAAEQTRQPATPAPIGQRAPTRPPASGAGRNDLATPAQVRAIYLIGRDQHGLTDEQVDARCREQYGRPTNELSKREASAVITALKNEAGAPA